MQGAVAAGEMRFVARKARETLQAFHLVLQATSVASLLARQYESDDTAPCIAAAPPEAKSSEHKC